MYCSRRMDDAGAEKKMESIHSIPFDVGWLGVAGIEASLDLIDQRIRELGLMEVDGSLPTGA